MVCALKMERLVLSTDHCNLKTNVYFHDPRKFINSKPHLHFQNSRKICSEAVNLVAEAVSMVDELQIEIDYPKFTDAWTLTSGLMCAAMLIVQSKNTGRVSGKIDRKGLCVTATFTAPTSHR